MGRVQFRSCVVLAELICVNCARWVIHSHCAPLSFSFSGAQNLIDLDDHMRSIARGDWASLPSANARVITKSTRKIMF